MKNYSEVRNAIHQELCDFLITNFRSSNQENLIMNIWKVLQIIL